MKIRVLHCIETISSGGVEKVRLTLIRGLDKEKFEHKIVCTWEGGAIANDLKEEGVELIPIGAFKHPFHYFKHKQVLKIIKTFNPHIIHGAIFEGMSMAAISGFIGGVPIRILEETSDPLMRTNRAILIQKMFLMISDIIIGVSPSVVKYLAERAKLSKKKIVEIYNGVDQPIFSTIQTIKELRRNLGLKEGDIIIGSVGRMFNEVKRFTDILDAIKVINNASIKILIVGDGPDRTLISDYAMKIGLASQFISVGFQNNTSDYYRLMDIFCIASAHEGFGLVAVEAMMHKLPVIATEVGGLKDIVVDGITGFLVPSRSPQSIANNIAALIQNPELRLRFGEAGYLRASENYSAARYCEQIENLYYTLLDQKGIVPNTFSN
ncbi:Glycosyltransferase involved in cell wall bisynthesis [Cyclobacterium lianum]|uniref:Glycosyltransferase involved in cell wall bisynthesis n=1 Tax=Cyclobacterium lianum TaxID=388280 RepID=A0A1M7QKQ0_9BACT|nr:glycosyltransferase [Cyclobacterium lianum]SHN31750.1 Glycosyltransferase involved in cell wall bisynthesis [Cyclobacterium lianum]